MIVELIKFKNYEKITSLSPSYEYKIFGGYIRNVNFVTLSEFILDKEKEILSVEFDETKSKSSGYYLLGPNSLSSRDITYNFLTWEHIEVKKLKESIISYYREAIDFFNVVEKHNYPLKIKCWANVLRKGEELKVHTHSNNNNPYCYLSGHVTIQCENTQTIYINPSAGEDKYHTQNSPGKINIFQSNIPHHTTKHMGEKERITIAFDIKIDNLNLYKTVDYIDFNPYEIE
jgi:hypothetical protein